MIRIHGRKVLNVGTDRDRRQCRSRRGKDNGWLLHVGSARHDGERQGRVEGIASSEFLFVRDSSEVRECRNQTSWRNWRGRYYKYKGRQQSKSNSSNVDESLVTRSHISSSLTSVLVFRSIHAFSNLQQAQLLPICCRPFYRL